MSSPPGQPRQRLRGTSFKQEYAGAAAKKPVTGRTRAPSMAHDATQFVLPEQRAEDRGKYTIVLDLDETLIYAREGPLYARPGLEDFFATLGPLAEVVVWTAGLRAYAQAIIRNVDKTNVVQHCVYRHSKWFTGQAGYRKDLGALGRDIEHSIIIENTPDCIRGYQQNGVLVSDYEGGEMPDYTIPALCDLLVQLVQSGMTVPQFITTNQMLVKTPVQTDVGDFIQCYTLNINNWRPGDKVRINKDLKK